MNIEGFPSQWDAQNDYPWDPSGNRYPFYEDGILKGAHTVYLHRIYMSDPEFLESIKPSLGKTRCASDKMFVMYQLINLIRNLEGCVVEVGVFQGGTAKLFTRLMPNREIHLYDTFEGIPQILNEHDIPGHMWREFRNTSAEVVAEYVGCRDRVFIHKGIFPNTFNRDDLHGRRVVFAHIDTDTYIGTKNGLEVIYPLLVNGGIVIIDDYKMENFEGIEAAVKEFLQNRTEPICQFAIYQCFIIKGTG